MDYLLSPDFVAGWVAGSIGIVATQPMDTIRIRMQVHNNLQSNATVRTHFFQILKAEGTKGLFRGVASPALTVGLMSAVLFQAFEMSKVWLTNLQYSTMFENRRLIIDSNNRNNRNNSIMYDEDSYPVILGAGAIAGAISCLITSPTELIKCIVQDYTDASTATIRQEFREVWHLYKNYGIYSGVFRGLGVTILRDTPALSIYFGLYELICNKFDATKQSTLVAFGGGFVAGLVSWAAVYPIDVIKTNYQLRKLKYGKLPLFQAVRHHIRVEGARSLYLGLSATVLRAGPQHAVVFVCYEYVKRNLIKMSEDSDYAGYEIDIDTDYSNNSNDKSNGNDNRDYNIGRDRNNFEYA